jgi:heat shock protein HslJ
MMPTLLRVAPLVLLAALAACSGPPGPSNVVREGHPATLAGTAWPVVSVGGRVPVAAAVPSATFAADRVTGSGGCNSYGGGYQYDPASGRIQMHNLVMTSMACLEAPRNDFETAFFRALGTANLAAVDARGRLMLSGPGGMIALEPDPQRAVEG